MFFNTKMLFAVLFFVSIALFTTCTQKPSFNFTNPLDTLNGGGIISTLPASAIPETISIPAVTSFSMGRPSWESGDSDEQPVHAVNLSAFSIGKYEVTAGQYVAFLNSGGNDDHFHDTYHNDNTYSWITKHGPGDYTVQSGKSNYPIVYVSWIDATNYCVWLSAQTGENWRLPTAAEWEYVATGGNPHRTYPWGDVFYTNYCNNVYDHGSWTKDGYSYLAPVGSYENGKSPFGVYDMSGNVHEWCKDWYSDTYYSSSPVFNPLGPTNGTYRVLRGGGFGSLSDCRASNRDDIDPSDFAFDGGFRVAK